MTKYKVGDKVRVRSDLVVGNKYFMENSDISDVFVAEMKEMKGKISTISRVYGKYAIKESSYSWTDEMFEPVTNKTEREEATMTTFRIKNVKTIDNKVVIVEFSNGDVQKAVCMPEDTFDFEKGVEVCVMKHLLGKSAYYKALKDADKQIEALKVAEEKAKADAEIQKRKAERTEKYKARKAERKRAARVAEMKEAYLSALKEYNGNIDFDADDIK